jgi:hypothetical protein
VYAAIVLQSDAAATAALFHGSASPVDRPNEWRDFIVVRVPPVYQLHPQDCRWVVSFSVWCVSVVDMRWRDVAPARQIYVNFNLVKINLGQSAQAVQWNLMCTTAWPEPNYTGLFLTLKMMLVRNSMDVYIHVCMCMNGYLKL